MITRRRLLQMIGIGTAAATLPILPGTAKPAISMLPFTGRDEIMDEALRRLKENLASQPMMVSKAMPFPATNQKTLTLCMKRMNSAAKHYADECNKSLFEDLSAMLDEEYPDGWEEGPEFQPGDLIKIAANPPLNLT